MDKIKLEAMLNICNILPSNLFEQTIKILSKIDSNLANTVLINKEGSLKTRFDNEEKKYFLANMFNKEKDSYRSPYTNKYFPDHSYNYYLPSEHLRNLEILFNKVFDNYRKAYYINGLSSVYLWPNPLDEGFIGSFLIKKIENYDEQINMLWEATHIIQVTINQLIINYQISSTINFCITKCNEIIFSGSITKSMENPKKMIDPNKIKDKLFHIENIGKMIENIENSLRKSIEYIYFFKINDILNCIRLNQIDSNIDYDNKMSSLQYIYNNISFSKESLQKELKMKLKEKNIEIENKCSLNT